MRFSPDPEGAESKSPWLIFQNTCFWMTFWNWLHLFGSHARTPDSFFFAPESRLYGPFKILYYDLINVWRHYSKGAPAWHWVRFLNCFRRRVWVYWIVPWFGYQRNIGKPSVFCCFDQLWNAEINTGADSRTHRDTHLTKLRHPKRQHAKHDSIVRSRSNSFWTRKPKRKPQHCWITMPWICRYTWLDHMTDQVMRSFVGTGIHNGPVPPAVRKNCNHTSS